MTTHTNPLSESVSARVALRLLGGTLASLCLLTGCVTKDLTTGEVVPRGSQRYPFERVERDAENLDIGMNESQVLMLLGSPAERNENGNVWVYLPERYGVVVPARALRLEFREQLLAEFDFRPIVLGQRL